MRKTVAALLTLTMVLAVAACDSFGPGPDFAIVSGSENTILEPIVQEFCASKNAKCTFKYEGSLDIGLALGSADGVKQDAVWPASGVWIDMFDKGRKVRNLTSIAQTPVVLGVRRSKAEALGWIGRDVSMSDILAAVKDGRLRFLMTSATQSNSGASAYLSMLASALGDKPVIEPGDLDNPAVRDTVRALLQGVERSSGSSGWLADLFIESAKKGTTFDAMWNYEAVLKETNDKLRALGTEPLYAIYPKEGVAMADSPLGFVDHGRGEAVETFYRELVAFLQSQPVASRIAATGRRLPAASAATPAAAEPDWNFDPARLVTAIRFPEPAVIRRALDLYQEALRKPSLTALCLDFSGSMQGEGWNQLQEAARFLFTPELSSEVLVQWSEEDRIIVIPFDGAPREGFEVTGKVADQAGALTRVVAEQADGGTDIYACALEALERIRQTPDLPRYLPAIVVMTDGRTNGSSDRFLQEWRQTQPPVPVFGITFGDAEKSQLEALAKATSARVFNGGADLVGAFRAARGYN